MNRSANAVYVSPVSAARWAKRSEGSGRGGKELGAGDGRAGPLGDEAGRGNVPGRQAALLDESVEAPVPDVGEGERRRAHRARHPDGLADLAGPGRRGAAPPVGGAGRGAPRGGRRVAAGPPPPPCPRPPIAPRGRSRRVTIDAERPRLVAE